jgi:hypothetical protein
VQLLGLLADNFSLEEIKTLAFNIGVDFDELEGEAKTPKIRELIRSAERQHDLDALIAAAARERPTAPWPQKQSPSAACPYRGLLSFEEQDALFFFAGERFVEQLVGAVNQRRLIALVGSSGAASSWCSRGCCHGCVGKAAGSSFVCGPACNRSTNLPGLSLHCSNLK